MHILSLPGFTPVDDPAAEPWLEEAERLATELSTQVFGDPCPEHIMIVYLAASVLWRESGGQPCWSQLDPDVLDARLADTTWWSIVGEGAALQLESFIEHLAREGLLELSAAVAVQRRLRPRMRPEIARLLSTHAPLRASGRPPRASPPPSYCKVPSSPCAHA